MLGEVDAYVPVCAAHVDDCSGAEGGPVVVVEVGEGVAGAGGVGVHGACDASGAGWREGEVGEWWEGSIMGEREGLGRRIRLTLG